MAKGKEVSSRSATFAKGGKTKMFGKQVAGSQKPGVSAHSVSGGDKKFAAGGNTKMFGKQCASPAKAR